jgi:quercetin dioxygenase-like cupin family protein
MERALGLRTPVPARLDLDGAEGVGLDPVLGHARSIVAGRSAGLLTHERSGTDRLWIVDVARAADGVFERGDTGRFTGEVWLRGTITAADATNIGVVHFSPAARTHWHRHPGGQFLYCVTGRGRVRTRGERGHILEPGDVIHVGPDDWHFHGGGPETPLVHAAVNGAGTPKWGEPVTDAEYDEGF